MPARTRRPTLTAVSAALALCTAVLTGCAAATGTGTPAAGAVGSSTPADGNRVDTKDATPAAGPSAASTPSADTASATTGTPADTATTGTPPPADAAPAAPAAPAPAAGAPLAAAVQPAALAALPIAPAFGWTPDGPLSSQDVQGRTVTLNECASVTGATTWQQQGYLSAARNPAGQQLFAFATPEAARAAFDRVSAGMDACQGASRRLQADHAAPQDATVTRTAAADARASWSRTWTGVGGMSADQRQANHLYALHQGAVLTLFGFDELQERPGPAHDTGTDPAVLDALAALPAADSAH
ncbi:sensor domain-containing protein [Kitasatospora sp. NPDC048286]|uniref:sensor domain-containing protein n=1 Tax=Kitasatospora sp. NPDC048286 TaxID=3364047 RepID=UPI003719D498